jgi:hypothetical protein
MKIVVILKAYDEDMEDFIERVWRRGNESDSYVVYLTTALVARVM